MPANRTILLVDDDNEIIETMRTVFDGRGYRVLVARDGNAGLTVAERENPDLIILDMMITGKEGRRDRAYAELLGVKDYIRKPFAIEKLVRSAEKILGTDKP